MSWIKNKIKDFIWGGRQFPYPYIDCDGNELNSVEDIWVTSKEKLEEAIVRKIGFVGIRRRWKGIGVSFCFL